MDSSSQSVITVKNLVKKYGDFTAVDDISFNVHQGEIFGLLGPNGAGKTTTLEIIETLRQKTSGEITILGRSIDEDPNFVKRSIGVQLQQSGYYPGLTLTETIQLFNDLYNANTNPIALLQEVELVEKAGAKYSDLSGGQKQRFSIATTLIHQPKIIFLDEPSTGLDPKARRHLWQLIQQIRDKGTTIVLTTHYMDEAEQLCNRVGVMDRGKIIALDTPDQLIDQLLKSGFKRAKEPRPATLEDVFLDLTGRTIGEDDE